MDGLNYGLKMGYISAPSEAPKGTASAAITLIDFDIVCAILRNERSAKKKSTVVNDRAQLSVGTMRSHR